MKITQIRHGSHIIEYKNKKFLVDPVLADKGTTFALPKGRVNEKNPLLPLPFDKNFVNDMDALIITHMHFDHFDKAAMDILPKNLPVYCHPQEAGKIRKAGFANVIAFDDKIKLDEGITIEAINGGKHGVGLAGKLMGRTTGYMFKDTSDGKCEPTVYLVGDSIWCDVVETAISKHEPKVIITFAGEAKLPFGKPITMSTNDIDAMAKFAQDSIIVVNHLDTWNHCYLTRDKLKSFIKNKPYESRISIPDDGETIVPED